MVERMAKSYWSNVTSASRDVACLVKHNLDLDIISTDKDPNGRFVSIDVKCESDEYSFSSIYAPNEGSSRKQFFKQLSEKLDSKCNKTQNLNVIIGGDFNCILNPSLDRRNDKGENTKCHDIGFKELSDLLINAQLEDTWRRRHPSQKKYTFFKKNSKSASRIDYFLVSKSIEHKVTKANIINVPLSDHSAVSLNINISDCQRGPGFWKMNTDILNSKVFQNTFEAFWTKWE